jgi:rhamnosyltransferase
MRCFAIYVVHGDVRNPDASNLARLASQRLRANVDYLLIVHPAAASDAFAAEMASIADETLTIGQDLTYSMGLKAGLARFYRDYPQGADWVLLTGSHMLGPFAPFSDRFAGALESDAALIAPYFHATRIDPRLEKMLLPERVPYLDFTVLSRDLLNAEEVAGFWSAAKTSYDYWEDFLDVTVAFGRLLEQLAVKVDYFVPPQRLESFLPSMFEAHTVVELGGPAIPKNVATLDPLVHDIQAIYARRALDGIKNIDPELHDVAWSLLLSEAELRTIYTNLEEIYVIPEVVTNSKEKWQFGTVAVFVHAYYVDVLKDIWQNLTYLPGQADLFISTASDGNKAIIEAFIEEQGWQKGKVEVRVVAVNRGRDMSSLFITFRDVILSNQYEMALRLHSKRTPQVGRQIGNAFRDHLMENLVNSREYIHNLYDLLEANPKMGFVVPPTIHIGFATLGHAWFTNKRPMMELAARLKIDVPVDRDTPIAAYGTMFWFRTDALKPLFEHEWEWTEFNQEPRHVDGGLAHLLERLMGYCAQSRRYRVITIASARQLARAYAKLEYKYQLLSALMPTGNIAGQQRYLDTKLKGMPVRARTYTFAENFYAKHIVRNPALLKMFRPLALQIKAFLIGGQK